MTDKAGQEADSDRGGPRADDLLSSPTWLERMADARARRQKVLAERARQGLPPQGLVAPRPPWEREETARRLAETSRMQGHDMREGPPPATPALLLTDPLPRGGATETPGKRKRRRVRGNITPGPR